MEFNTADIPTPKAAGMPEKFTAWRRGQKEAVGDILNSGRRFTVMVCPTGFGKSLMYMTAAVLRRKLDPRHRTAVLTSTKGLQTQLHKDFKSIGAADLRGKNAYQCMENPAVSCENGPCSYGIPCQYKGSGCAYWESYRKASAAPILITNYACFMAVKRFRGRDDGIGSFGMIVCDEGHSVPDAVSGFLTCRLFLRDERVRSLSPPVGSDFEDWAEWAQEAAKKVKSRLDSLRKNLRSGVHETEARDYKKYSAILRTLQTLNDFSMSAEWVVEEERGSAVFSPVTLADSGASNVLFGNSNVVFTSATIREKTLDLLGIIPADRKIKEYAHPFPADRRRVIFTNTVRLNAASSDTEYRLLTAAVDSIISRRRDRKGIIHTVSFARADIVSRMSRHKRIMRFHRKGGDIEKIVEQFRHSKAPSVLVSPSVGTGYDFPYDDCRYQIILKLPYPDTRGKLMQARCRLDSDYGPYIAALSTVQIHGRGVRAADDLCETFLLDGNYVWFVHKYGDFMPEWFRSVISRVSIIPKPPEIQRRT